MLQLDGIIHGFALAQQEHYKISSQARANQICSHPVENFKMLSPGERKSGFPARESMGRETNVCSHPAEHF